MIQLNEFISETLGETDNWFYVFFPKKSHVSMGFYTGGLYNTSYETNMDLYVTVKTKKNISDDNSLIERAWKKKYPDMDVPKHWDKWLDSGGDLTVEKWMKKLIKLVDTNKVKFSELEEFFNKNLKRHTLLKEHPELLEQAYNKFK